MDTMTQTPTITALAARHAQLWNTPMAGRGAAIMAEQAALSEAILHFEPTNADEVLTLTRLVWEGIDDDDPLAGALDRVCRALERDGARNLRFHPRESVDENDSEIW
jgi:hypothetical protein